MSEGEQMVRMGEIVGDARTSLRLGPSHSSKTDLSTHSPVGVQNSGWPWKVKAYGRWSSFGSPVARGRLPRVTAVRAIVAEPK